MRIENVQRTDGQPSDRGFTNLCTFTLALTDQVKLYGVKLIRAPDGNTLVYPPDTATGGKAWSMAPGLRDEVSLMVQDAIDESSMKRFARIASL